MPRWIQHLLTGELIPAHEYVRPNTNKTAAVHGDIEAFVSPVDRSVIDDRKKLREHNKRHGVTNTRDYGENYFKRKAKEREVALDTNNPKAKAARRDALSEAMAYHNTRGR
jgi:hypothetical protein